MFVVHTVNQLEEAVRVGAEEILVTGGLASNVHEAYLLKSSRGSVAGEESVAGKSAAERGQKREVDREERHSSVPVWGVPSLIMITGEYCMLDFQLDCRSPSMVLQRARQH